MIDFTLRYAIEMAVKAEELGINFYSKLANRFPNNENITGVFNILARDEIVHKKQFLQLLETFADETFKVSEDEIVFLNACDISNYFPSMENIPENITEKEVLKYAFNFEKETVLYYAGIKDIIGENKVLDEIIKREKTHIIKLMKYLINDNKFRGIEDNY